jgi:hypothetical protein
MKTKVIGYWAATAFLVFALLSGGVAELARRRENVEGRVHLGYPLHSFTETPGGGVLLLSCAPGIGVTSLLPAQVAFRHFIR